jgi:hypothetical protein
LIDPNIDITRKKVPFLADFSKIQGREEKKHMDDEEVYVRNFEFEEMKDPGERKVIVHDFGKVEDRFKVDLKR